MKYKVQNLCEHLSSCHKEMYMRSNFLDPHFRSSICMLVLPTKDTLQNTALSPIILTNITTTALSHLQTKIHKEENCGSGRLVAAV